jgi:hypothetical protein
MKRLQLATLTGHIYHINFDTNKTIIEFKKEISKKIDIIPERQKIIFCGKVLENDKSVDTYNVQRHTKLHLIIIDEREYWEEKFNKMIENQGKQIDDKMKNVALLNKKIRQVLKEHVKLLTTDITVKTSTVNDKSSEITKSNPKLNLQSNPNTKNKSWLCINKR